MYDPQFYCEVTIRSLDGEFRFDPNDLDLTQRIYGEFAVAARRSGVEIFIFHFMSNHYHGLYGFRAPEQLVAFLAYLHGGLARLAKEIRTRPGPFWAKPKVVQVATDATTVAQRFKYILSQAVKADICRHPGEFPGASAVDALLYGTPLLGRKVDRSRQCRDAQRLVGGAKGDDAYETHVEVPLSVPRCWAELPTAELRLLYLGIAEELVAEVLTGEPPQQPPGPAEPSADGGSPVPGSPVPGSCLIHENAGDCLGLGEPEPPPAPEPEPQLPASLEAVAPPKVVVPQRQGEDGEPYRQGEVKPKLVEGKKKRGKFPLLLSSDQRLARDYEQRYELAVQAYYAAKRSWRRKSKHRDGALRAAKIALPAGMLLGTLPLFVGG